MSIFQKLGTTNRTAATEGVGRNSARQPHSDHVARLLLVAVVAECFDGPVVRHDVDSSVTDACLISGPSGYRIDDGYEPKHTPPSKAV